MCTRRTPPPGSQIADVAMSVPTKWELRQDAELAIDNALPPPGCETARDYRAVVGLREQTIRDLHVTWTGPIQYLRA